MKIGALAQIANCSVETIRYYEKEGLMPAPLRQENNYRDYTQAHLDRLRFIRNCRVLDLNHDEIRELLRLMSPERKDCDSVNKVLEEHLEHVRSRIIELTQLETQLQELQTFCQHHCYDSESNGAADLCGILQGLFTLEQEQPVSLQTHNKHGYTHHK